VTYRIPRRFAPMIYGVMQAGITSAIATAIAIQKIGATDEPLIGQWFTAWLLAWLTMLPVVIFISPFIQRAVLALTTTTTKDS
jgi:hypothetical protein